MLSNEVLKDTLLLRSPRTVKYFEILVLFLRFHETD